MWSITVRKHNGQVVKTDAVFSTREDAERFCNRANGVNRNVHWVEDSNRA